MLKAIKYKKQSLVLVAFLLLSSVAGALNSDDVPRIVLAFGRLHPLILHLPIGALILTFFLDVAGRIRKNYPKQTITLALGFSAVFSIIACVFGYFLSLEDGYGGSTLDIHFWTGITTAGLITTLYSLSKNETGNVKRLVFPLFLITLVVMSIAGHYGSVLTHGEDFLTEYIEAPKKQETIEVIDSLNMYDHVVLKILDDKCIQCHNETKRKGGLSLASKKDILNGGDSGLAIRLGVSEESLLYKHIMLPVSDENHMPPEGKPQLTKDELWIIKYWLDQSEVIDNKVVKLKKNDTLNRLLKDYLVVEERHIAEASIEAVQDAESEGFLVRKLVPANPELWVKFKKDTITKKNIKTLQDLKEQIIELDLSQTNLTDALAKELKKLENLEKLELTHTQITDKTLNVLKALPRLKVLNLVGNQGITGSGLKALLETEQIETVYVWNTGIDRYVAEDLSRNLDVKINTGAWDYAETAQLGIPELHVSKDLFLDTLMLKLETNIKDVAIFYNRNNSEPDSTSTPYTRPIVLDSSTTLTYKAYKKGWNTSDVGSKTFYKVNHKVIDYTLLHQPDEKYPGASKLFDFQLGSTNFKDEKWAGFLGKDIDAVVDFGNEASLNKISVSCLALPRDWIMLPTEITLFVSNNKTTGFKQVASKALKRSLTYDDNVFIQNFSLEFQKTEGRYFKVLIKSPKELPNWHEGAGNPPWIFVSELMFW
ncbi:c-type cytochrome domain-containing protein [Aestuariibaculum sediminum]|uniref:Chitobiase/beta-hexosaminidase C-terminal domain-containing protein n=1 Tax=Aestuariibaculum sediminum TaxID=2770637 RepID=A0A8J6Q295_9FLAO|nr:c-type cytochrome domain-containing protein [Aestuariibaculum sediminum]MBD0831911.1 chitobiase/beta-hexosaminidase C-terminal domain-containing protein [Aestuariibaculum sediminum]